MKYRKHLRLHPDIYRIGWFFVTIVSRNRTDIFHQDCSCRACPARIIEDRLASISKRHPGWHLDWSVIMPNHVHFIAWSERNDGDSLAGVIRVFKSISTLRYNRQLGSGGPIWQPNYYEHVIRTDRALAHIRKYIEENPLKEKMDWGNL